MSTEYKKIKEAVAYIRSVVGDFNPESGIVLGTGLGGLLAEVQIDFELDYSDVPNFVTSTVEFHQGKLVFGVFNGKKVVVMQGRFHFYEGYSMQEIVFPIRVLKFLGIDHLLISNAAGGINQGFELSDLMLITDHINLMPENPLVGPNESEIGDRWPDMFEAYSKKLNQKAKNAAQKLGIHLRQGVYAAVSGPNLETPAEYKYLSIIGADAVGMSTVPEVIACAQMGLPCLAVSVITDLCFPSALEPVSIEKIIAAAGAAEPKMIELFKEIVA